MDAAKLPGSMAMVFVYLIFQGHLIFAWPYTSATGLSFPSLYPNVISVQILSCQ